MLSVFGDGSADETKQRLFAVGGVIGSEEAWLQLERKWIARTGKIHFTQTIVIATKVTLKGTIMKKTRIYIVIWRL